MQATDHENQCTYSYVANQPPITNSRVRRRNIHHARMLIETTDWKAQLDKSRLKELESKCNQLEQDRYEKEQIEQNLLKKCRSLEDLVEKRNRDLAKIKNEFEATKTQLSGSESDRYSLTLKCNKLQEIKNSLEAQYENSIEAGFNEKQELTQSLERKQLKVEQDEKEINKLTNEIQKLRQQNLRLVEQNCEIKRTTEGSLKAGVGTVVSLCLVIMIAVFIVGFSVY